MIKTQPQLDPIRLELAAGLYDSVVWQLEMYCEDAQHYCLTVEDVARLQAPASSTPRGIYEGDRADPPTTLPPDPGWSKVVRHSPIDV